MNDDDEDVEEVDADEEYDEHREADEEGDEDDDLVLRLSIDEFKKDTEVSISEAISDAERLGEGGMVVSELDPSECEDIERGEKGE